MELYWCDFELRANLQILGLGDFGFLIADDWAGGEIVSFAYVLYTADIHLAKTKLPVSKFATYRISPERCATAPTVSIRMVNIPKTGRCMGA